MDKPGIRRIDDRLAEINDFKEWSKLQEISLRGYYITMAVDVEVLLTTIIAECFCYRSDEIKSYIKKKDGTRKDLHEMNLYEQIEVCKHGLKKYWPGFYESHERDFRAFEDLKEARNKFAHEKMDFFEDDRSKVELRKLVSGYKVETTVEQIKDLWSELHKLQTNAFSILRIVHRLLWASRGRPKAEE
jgi:hypothetical protein